MAIPDEHKWRYIFHFTDIHNLDSIIKNGLLCTNDKKEKEIEHSSLTPTEKENQKRLWKEWIDETTKGFKDELKRAGRIVELG